ncbi:MAG TPA: glycosyltransferase family 2 protein [Hanamia sp.]|nr:glycosyltransferase family 2 protein [Hanamia sp.]
MDFPKISIITPSFNQGIYLEQTILSVLNQNYPNLEYIIIDGGSTDHSVEIIKKYEQRLTFWVSENDRGQAHAINKGLKHCTGTIFNWINSDDYLSEGALSKVAEAFKRTADTDIVAGEVIDFNEKGILKKVKNQKLEINEYLKKEVELIYHQPAVWLRMDHIKETGFFNEQLHFCFDQEYMMRYLMKYSIVCYVDEVLAHFRMHENSKSVSLAEKFAWDFRQMYKNFWLMQKDDLLKQKAKRKYLEYEWPLLNGSINKEGRSRFTNFSKALKVILQDPVHRLNKDSIGWLKHILMGAKNHSVK